MFCTLFFAVALARPPEDGTVTDHIDARQEAWAQLGPDALMQQALTLQSEGRRAAALERLAYLNEHHPAPVVTFQIGKTLELDEDYTGALAAYDDILVADAEPDILHNAAFRRAIVLEDIGEHRASLAQIKALSEAGGVEPGRRAVAGPLPGYRGAFCRPQPAWDPPHRGQPRSPGGRPQPALDAGPGALSALGIPARGGRRD